MAVKADEREVYALVDETGASCYVGQSVSARRRAYEHKYRGRGNLAVRVLQRVPVEEADAAEYDWIVQLRALGHPLPLNASRDGQSAARDGERNLAAKLTDAQVREVRERRALGESGAALAREFSITTANVAYVVTGATRLAAGGPIQPRQAREKLTAADVREIRRLSAEGVPQLQIAERFRVAQSHISDVVTRRRRARVV